MKHRVILTLDAEQLNIMAAALDALRHSSYSGDTDKATVLHNLLNTAREVCENHDRADEAERKLSQLAARSVTH